MKLTVVSLSSLLLFSVACSGSVDTAVIDASIARVTVDNVYLGGALGHCYSPVPSVSYVRATRELTSTACTEPPMTPGSRQVAPVTLTTSTRVLSPTEASNVEGALANVHTSGSHACGIDGQDYVLTTSDSANRERKYSAYDTNCYGAEEVTSLSDVYTLLVALR